MKIVTQTYVPAIRLGVKEAVRLISEAGFDGADLSLFSVKDAWRTDPAAFIKEAEAAKKEYRIPFLQAHAPFPGKRYGDEAYNEVMDEHVRAAIEVAGALEAGIIVVHPIHCPTLSAAEQMEWNLEYYRSFEPLCKKWGIKIAIENMWGVRDGKIVPNVCSDGKELGAYFDALASDAFTVCADLGHFPMVGVDAAEELRTLGARTGALHIHDNNLIHDWHNIPFSGKMNWDSITSALAETNYKGTLTFETDKGYLEPMPTELFFSALKHMAEVGRYLKSQIKQKQ